MLLRGLLCGLIAVLVGCGGGGEEPVAREDLPAKLDAELAKRSQELGVPGAAAALYRRGELVWWGGGRGKADIEDAPERFYLAQLRQPARRFRPADWLAAIRPPHPEDSDVYNNSGFVVAMPGFHTELTHLPKEGLTLFAVWNDDLIDQGRIPQTLMEVALSDG